MSTTVDRETLGRRVREVWVAWANEQPNPKPHWLTPWEELSEPDKEVDRRIGEVLFGMGAARLPDWERLFETTNPTQAHAEHVALIEKRGALQRELNATRTELAEAKQLRKEPE